MRPKISVIMLTYNRRQYLDTIIRQVLGQTYTNYEFIIIDNGSTDGSEQLLDSYKGTDSRVRIYRIDKCTISEGRIAGMNRVSEDSDYVAFIDDDDEITSEYLQKLIDEAVRTDADVVVMSSTKKVNDVRTDNCITVPGIYGPEDAVMKLLERKECNASLASKLIRLSLYREVHFPSKSMHEDIYVTYKLFANAKKAAFIADKEYCFRRHQENTSAFTGNFNLLRPETLDEYLAVYRERTEYLTRKLPAIRDYIEYSEWSYMISMCNKIITYHLVDCSSYLEHIIEVLTANYDNFMNSDYIKDFEVEWMHKYLDSKIGR